MQITNKNILDQEISGLSEEELRDYVEVCKDEIRNLENEVEVISGLANKANQELSNRKNTRTKLLLEEILDKLQELKRVHPGEAGFYFGKLETELVYNGKLSNLIENLLKRQYK